MSIKNEVQAIKETRARLTSTNVWLLGGAKKLPAGGISPEAAK
jgi:hypothetical protein